MAENRINFTKESLNGLPLPEPGKRLTWWDTKVRGLCVRVTDKGAKTFSVVRKVQGRMVRVSIGPWPIITVEQARKEAAKLLGQIALGEDPQREKRKLRQDLTFGDMFAWYMETHAKPRKATWKGDQGRFKNHCGAIANKKVSTITKADIRAIHRRITDHAGPGVANRTLAMIRCAFNKAIAHERIAITTNPAHGIEANRENERDRFVMPDEMERFLDAVMAEPNEEIRDFVLLCLFTGQRRGNVLAMRWDQIDWTGALWHIPHTKNGTSHMVPLHPLALEVLENRKQKAEGPWVLPASGKAGHLSSPEAGWRRICERADIRGLWIHDLRRTHASLMAGTGASLVIIGKALNHLSQQTTKRYARLWTDPVRDAQNKALSALMGKMGFPSKSASPL